MDNNNSTIYGLFNYLNENATSILICISYNKEYLEQIAKERDNNKVDEYDYYFVRDLTEILV